MKLFAALFLFAATSLFAVEKTVKPLPTTTREAMDFQTLFGNSQSNFDELYAGVSTAATVTYAASVALDFTTGGFKTITATGNLTLTTANLAAGQTLVLRVIASGGSRTLTLPAGWVFVGAAAPTTVASGKTGLFVLRSFGTADAAVVAKYDVQP